MTITYRTSPDQWSPGYMAVHIYDDSRFAVVIDGRPVFSGAGYRSGPWHDDRQQVADLLNFASHAASCDNNLPVKGQVWPDDLGTMADDLAPEITGA